MKQARKLLFIDNYDSFANIIAKDFSNAGADVTMYKSDTRMDIINRQEAEIILLGPGPNGPNESGNYQEIIDKNIGEKGIFGICLGHQTIIHYFKGNIIQLSDPAHGVAQYVKHDEKTIFENLDNPSTFTRYNSLGIYKQDVPSELEISAWIGNMVMGIRHKEYKIEGVQFHPESVLSNQNGINLMKNVLKYL